MSEEVFDCVYNLWTGFVGKATCEAGFLKCDEMSCPAYTRRPKKNWFTQRMMIEKAFNKWAEENGVAKVPNSVVAFLEIEGCLNDDAVNEKFPMKPLGAVEVDE